MTLFEQTYHFGPQDTETHVAFSFDCPENTAQLRILLEFSPMVETDEKICRPQIERALEQYYADYPRALQPMDWQQFMPIKNLITLSLDREGEYVGNAHRCSGQQEHHIGTRTASRGFLPVKELRGHWGGMLHLHEVISPCCTARLVVEGEKNELETV